MLCTQGRLRRFCSGWSRRDFLEVGALSWLGLVLSGVLKADSQTKPMVASFGRAKNCILLFLTGGPPQHDTWDLKPDAPVEIRGELRPIATSVPGIHVSELFPMLAQQAHHYCLVRSVTHDDATHSSASYTMLTGTYHGTPGLSSDQIRPSAKDHPHLGCLVSLLKPAKQGMPPFVSLPEFVKDAGVNPVPGQDAGFLGRRYAPFLIEAKHERKQLIVPALTLPNGFEIERLSGRRALLKEMDQNFALKVQEGDFAEMDAFRVRALDMVSSPAARAAFDLDREPSRSRERYGDHLFGKGCLCARRLVEAGVRLVTVYWHYEGPDDSPVWDTHRNNYPHLRQRLTPPTDRAISALLSELAERGLLDETLVICLGEFGRSPKINKNAGRDHWSKLQSILLAGAGIPEGSIYGASDRQGGAPAENPVSPPDLFATFMHLLGLPPDTLLKDLDGRELPATRGSPIQGLVG